MKILPPAVDYRAFRLRKINDEAYRHLKLLLYWPLYGLLFLYVERLYPVESYHVMHCALDDWIPFNEWFLIPYLFWFVFLAGMHVYTLLYDTEAFKRMMHFIILTYSAAILAYLVWPTCQDLRPASFPRDNLLTAFIAGFYQFDTNTNVCPSIPVIGSLAVMFTAWHCRGLAHWGWKLAFTLTAVLICASTLFIKQHSALDILAALPICLIAYKHCFSHCGKSVGALRPEKAKP